MKTYTSYILLLLAAALLIAGPAPAAQNRALAEVDALLESPGLDLAQVRQVLFTLADLHEKGTAPRVPLLTLLARTAFIVADLSPRDQRGPYYEQGQTYAELLVREDPKGAAGHYWLALTLAGRADVGSKFQGRRLLPQIMAELKLALAADENYDQAGGHRVLGRIYYEAPGWPISVGDLRKSLHHLTAAVRLAPQNSTNHLYLGELLLRRGDAAQARQELERVLTSNRHAIWPRGVEDDQRKARRLLQEMALNVSGQSFMGLRCTHKQ